MKRLIIILLLLLCSSIVSIASAQDVDYVNSILWNWIHEVKIVDDYAYCVFQNGLVILDVSNPESPELVSKTYIEGPQNELIDYSIAFYSHYALIAKGETDLHILDIADPANPVYVSNFSVFGRALGIDMMDHYAVVASTHGLYVIDVQTPSEPQLVGQWGAIGGENVVISGHYAYVAKFWDGLYIYDLTDPYSPQRLGGYNCQGTNDIFIKDNYAYIATWNDGLVIVEISDPTDPRFVCRYDTPAYTFDVVVIDSLAYLADASSMEIINVAEPQYPTWVGSYADADYYYVIFVSNNNCYLADRLGLKIIDIEDPSNPILEGRYLESYSTIWSVYIQDNYLYTSGFNIFDISDPVQPAPIGSLPDRNIYFDITARNDTVYAAAGTEGLVIIDSSDPANPNVITSYELSGYTRGVFIENNYAYLAAERLEILDISNPEEPELVGYYQIDDQDNRKVVVRNSLAFLAYGYAGLVIINISDPVNPYYVGNQPSDFFAWDVCLYGDYACVASGINFQFIDISDPHHPVEISTFQAQTFLRQARGIYCENGYAYLADENLVILDITDIANPVQVADYQTPGLAVGVAADGDYIYVADESSVLILRFTETGIIEEVGRIPGNFALSQNFPNPFNSSTNINYTLPHQSEVTIDIYDILGRRVETLVNTQQQAGNHQIIWDAKDTSTGMYFYKIRADDYSETKRMLLLK